MRALLALLLMVVALGVASAQERTDAPASIPSARCTMNGASAGVDRQRAAISPPGSPCAPAGWCSNSNECAQP